MEEKNILLLYFEEKKRLVRLKIQQFHIDRREQKSVAHYASKILFTPNYVFHILIAEAVSIFEKKYSGAGIFFSSYMQLIWKLQIKWPSDWFRWAAELTFIWTVVVYFRVASRVVIWVSDL